MPVGAAAARARPQGGIVPCVHPSQDDSILLLFARSTAIGLAGNWEICAREKTRRRMRSEDSGDYGVHQPDRAQYKEQVADALKS